MLNKNFFQTVRTQSAVKMQFFCTVSNAFAATPIRSIDQQATHSVMTLNLLGLTGVNSVLKQQVLTELLSTNQLQAWHQWYYETLYRAWSLYHWPVQSETQGSALQTHFLPYCQTKPRGFSVNYGQWGFCYPSIQQFKQQLQHQLSGIHGVQTTVGWLPVKKGGGPQRLGNNTLLGENIPLSKCGLRIDSIVDAGAVTKISKMQLIKLLAPWPKLWGIPILEVRWSIQINQSPPSFLLGKSRLGNHGFKSTNTLPQKFSHHFIVS
jgi:hypothetical protein